MLEELLEQLGTTAATPEADHLLSVWYEGGTHYLPEYQAQTFHHMVYQLLLMSSRAHWDIYTEVELLTTRVKKDEEDWEKLKQLLKYI